MSHALIVDDDVDSLTALAVLVNREGFTTDTASTLREAREKVAQQRPDVVLLDLVLPDGNGMDLFQDIEPRSVTEVVLITGHASIETSVEALRLGAADYLIKPVNVKQLESILSQVARPADLKAEINKLRGD
ncbi:MAG TPA: response regulator, partial [Gammaproteobacteria bacterium]|nr:response regulator [Gammaproteobacteria bacterium]